jgi:hypothetical protein
MPTTSALPALHLLGKPFLVVAIVGLLLIAVAVIQVRGRRSSLGGIKGKPLLTDNEKAFFGTLQRALPGHIVFPQVAFAAFLTHDSKLSAKARFALRAKFNRKIADFVICERDTLKIAAIVELDDRTHTTKTDQERDALTSAAGYKTVRFQSKQKPSEGEIAALFSLPQEQPAAEVTVIGRRAAKS